MGKAASYHWNRLAGFYLKTRLFKEGEVLPQMVLKEKELKEEEKRSKSRSSKSRSRSRRRSRSR